LDEAIRHHLGKDIKDQVQLTGGYTFQTWLLMLSDNTKVVFRAQRDFDTGGGRKIVIADVLAREKFFYDTVNHTLGHICPEVYVVDGSCMHYDMSFCIMEYMEGTPLHICFDGFDLQIKRDVLYRIGELTAQINGIKIDDSHPYMSARGAWEAYIADRLQERLKPLVHNDVITQDEIDRIADFVCQKKALSTNAFLHLDMRRINMIYSKGSIYILDAENCEFGDPLWEIATIDVAGELEPALIEGYGNIDMDSALYHCYKMERLALVLHLFMNEIKSDTQSTKVYLEKFHEVKNRLFSMLP